MTICCQVVVYVTALVIYRLTLHPLSRYPGPRVWAASSIPWVYHHINGDLPHTLYKLHSQYGETVRVAPDELSFVNPSAWKDIYGVGRTNIFKKDMKVYPRMSQRVDSILTADNANHPRHRKLLNSAFSEKALREQEPLFQRYVAQMVQKLLICAKGPSEKPVVDMVKWYNWITFDIVGHLSFGEPFGCLEDETYHPWVSLIFGHIKGGAFVSASKRFPPANHILQMLVPKSLLEKRATQLALTQEKVDRRMKSKSNDTDFLSFILKENGPHCLNREEIEVDSSILIIAGSETSATILAGATYYLLKNPETLMRLKREVRTEFESENEINFLSLQRLRYLNACIQEVLRLYPPIPMGLTRVLEGSPEGAFVNGQYIPEGVRTRGQKLWSFSLMNAFVQDQGIGRTV